MRDREPNSDVAFFTLDGTSLSVYLEEEIIEDVPHTGDGRVFSGSWLTRNEISDDKVGSVLAGA